MTSASPSPKRYLIELDQDRERQAVRRALRAGLGPLLQDLRIRAPFFWAILELPKRAALPKASRRDSAGDIDILFGALSTDLSVGDFEKRRPFWRERLASFNVSDEQVDVFIELEAIEQGRLVWPPRTQALAAVEAKAAVYDLSAEKPLLRSTKAGKRKLDLLHAQLSSLLALGVERAALLELIATPPQSSHLDGQAFLQAAFVSSDAAEAAKALFALRRLPETVGHWFWSMGAVCGDTEDMRGAGQVTRLRATCSNPILPGNVALNTDFSFGLKNLLSATPNPRSASCFFSYCDRCRALHATNLETDKPNCTRVKG